MTNTKLTLFSVYLLIILLIFTTSYLFLVTVMLCYCIQMPALNQLCKPTSILTRLGSNEQRVLKTI